MPTVNEQLADAAIGHAVDLSRYSNGVVRRILQLLNRTDADLFGQLGAALASMSPEAFTVEWLEQMLTSVRRLNLSAYQAIERELTTELQALAAYEAQYQYSLFRETLPLQVVNLVGVATVSAETAYAAAMSRPFQGVLLREWAQRAGEARMGRIRDAIRIGFTSGETVDQMVRRIRGTRAAGYADGLIEIDRRNAAAVVRTAVQHTAATVRDRFHAENADLIKAIEWVSTLDSRTTPECMLRGGKRYTRDHKPIGHKLPWGAGPGRLHWNAVPAGSIISTLQGMVPVESVAIGDLVLTHTGAYQPVTDKLSKRNESGVIRAVRLESGGVLRATDDHPVLTTRGWVFAGALKVGDELFRDTEGAGEVFGAVGQVVTETKDCPPGLDERGVTISRPIDLAAAAVGLEGHPNIGPSEVEDVAIEVVLRNPSIIESKGELHHLLALAHVLGEMGRKGLADLLASLLGQGAAGKALGCSFVDSGGGLRRKRFLKGAIERHWVPLRHQLGVVGVFFARLFGQAVRPMLFACRHDSSAGSEVNHGLVGLGPDRESGSLRPLGKGAVREPLLSFDGAKGLPELDVVNKNELAVVGQRFRHDKVVALELQAYHSNVYDLETEEDSSYICNGIAVSNCRSTATAVTRSFRELGLDMDEVAPGTRASMDGQVPAETTYADWIKKQSAQRQDDILGPTRGKLLREGGLALDRFADDRGRWLTLDQLRERDAAAFKRAGV